MVVLVALLTLAAIEPNLTSLSLAVVEKLVPVIVTPVPTGPVLGVKPVIVGLLDTGGGPGLSSLAQDEIMAAMAMEKSSFFIIISF
jgi:hypothetical protein